MATGNCSIHVCLLVVVSLPSTIILSPLPTPSLAGRWLLQIKVGHLERKGKISPSRYFVMCQEIFHHFTWSTCVSSPNGITSPLRNQSLARGGIIFWPIRPLPGAGGEVTCWLGGLGECLSQTGLLFRPGGVNHGYWVGKQQSPISLSQAGDPLIQFLFTSFYQEPAF